MAKVVMELFKEMAMNNYQWHSSKAKLSKPAHVYNVDAITALAVQVEILSKKIDGLLITKQPTQVIECDLYGEGHGNQECQVIKSLAMPSEHVDYMGNAFQPQNNPYSNIYNLGGRNHPNFSQGNQGQNRQNPLLGFQ